jgi:hypothetical protein
MFKDEDFNEEGELGKRGIDRNVAEDAFFPYDQDDPEGVIRVDTVTVMPPTPPDLPDGWEDAPLKDLPSLLEGASDEVRRFVMLSKGTVPGGVRTMRRLASRAPGMIMRRFPVPEADPFLFAELRPVRPIWTGKPIRSKTHEQLAGERQVDGHKTTLERHLERGKTTPDMVRDGMTVKEYARAASLDGFEVTMGGDHFGRPIADDVPHVHVKVAKYLFKANVKKTIPHPGGPHSHVLATRPHGRAENLPVEHFRTELGLFNHVWFEHALGDEVRGKGLWAMTDLLMNWPDLHRTDEHEHEVEVDATRFAKRLSSHPMGFARIASVNRVFFALEGCLKEAALVTAGEATFSCPSVSLWDAQELGAFAENHLLGKAVFVVCDSDWEREDDDSVIRQTLEARDALRLYGVDAYMTAPQPGSAECKHKDKKHGVDDHLGPCAKGDVDDLIVVDREAQYGVADMLVDRRVARRGRWQEGVERDALILRWLSTHASEKGVTRVSLRSVAKSLLRDKGFRGELDERTLNNAAKSAERAVWSLNAQGFITGAESLKDRRGAHLRQVELDWSGELTVDYSARSVTHKTTVRNVMAARRITVA